MEPTISHTDTLNCLPSFVKDELFDPRDAYRASPAAVGTRRSRINTMPANFASTIRPCNQWPDDFNQFLHTHTPIESPKVTNVPPGFIRAGGLSSDTDWSSSSFGPLAPPSIFGTTDILSTTASPSSESSCPWSSNSLFSEVYSPDQTECATPVPDQRHREISDILKTLSISQDYEGTNEEQYINNQNMHVVYTICSSDDDNKNIRSIAQKSEKAKLEDETTKQKHSKRGSKPRKRAKTSVSQTNADQCQKLSLGRGRHQSETDEKKVTLYKTELCRSFEETGKCKFGNKCLFAHGQDEMRNVKRHPRYKTEICRSFWEEGQCKYGKRCCFLHVKSGDLPESEQPIFATKKSRIESFGLKLDDSDQEQSSLAIDKIVVNPVDCNYRRVK